ncbi:tRNA (adenosine(37)-N6)-dimethylallyltransferase MiaA [Bombiscardovia coagulans]|uniref:tRNA dimethylallyltransferase n=1 Tax=Bombiscardovia coagulans TaxID=686666 RepID=A0A261EVV8_9BIFI|nr:tRNA (adenosine(37)-N6)-dimethylallyltransferase MiaA [Bombiscardovia coagulans]OZG51004.1 tRNA dimethylallyltransferase [Bombiscardovia coagulans]
MSFDVKKPPVLETAIHSQSKPKRVISIVGPTASGKTALAIHLAQHFISIGQDTEIINADAYQMYRGLDIGTAKPSPEEQQAVTHHLIDILDPEEAMSVARFQVLARQEIRSLQGRGIRPILVGGSGLYARAAIDELSFPGTDPVIRQKLEEKAAAVGPGALFQELEQRDPMAAANMDPRNVRRTIRALEVIEITGTTFSSTLPRYRYLIPSVQLGLDLPRNELDKRIALRTSSMRNEGFVNEVKRLSTRLGPTASRALGYQQVEDYLEGKSTEDEAFAYIEQKTRRLARKQMSWFGRDPRIHWLDALSPNLLEQSLAIITAADKGEYEEADAKADELTSHHYLGAIREKVTCDD